MDLAARLWLATRETGFEVQSCRALRVRLRPHGSRRSPLARYAGNGIRGAKLSGASCSAAASWISPLAFGSLRGKRAFRLRRCAALRVRSQRDGASDPLGGVRAQGRWR
jgi:hypothetical protein